MGTTTFKRKFRTHGINYIKKESDTFDPIEWCKLEKTKSYGVRATTIEGQNAFAPTLCFD